MHNDFKKPKSMVDIVESSTMSGHFVSGVFIARMCAFSFFLLLLVIFFFFFNDTATTEIYTLSLHDALPISRGGPHGARRPGPPDPRGGRAEERLRRGLAVFVLVGVRRGGAGLAFARRASVRRRRPAWRVHVRLSIGVWRRVLYGRRPDRRRYPAGHDQAGRHPAGSRSAGRGAVLPAE